MVRTESVDWRLTVFGDRYNRLTMLLRLLLFSVVLVYLAKFGSKVDKSLSYYYQWDIIPLVSLPFLFLVLELELGIIDTLTTG